MEDTVAGSCVCGAVAFEIKEPYRAFQYCHCSRCRKRGGGAHAANLFVLREQFTWVRGEDNLQRFELPSAKYWCTSFCTTCGSYMPWLSKNGHTMIVPAGGLEGDPGMRPQRNIYWGSRAAWYVHVAELECFETVPG